MSIYRSIASLMFVCGTLTFSHLAALQIEEEVVEAPKVASQLTVGECENGLKFMLVSSSDNSENKCVSISGAEIAVNEESTVLFHLLHHAMFQGSKDLTGVDIADRLNALGLNIHLDGYVYFNPFEQKLQFSLVDEDHEISEKLVQLIHSVILFPRLGVDEIELARVHLSKSHLLNDRQKQLLSYLTVQEIRDFYSKIYALDKMRIAISGVKDNAIMLDKLSNLFNEPKTELSIAVDLLTVTDQKISEQEIITSKPEVQLTSNEDQRMSEKSEEEALIDSMLVIDEVKIENSRKNYANLMTDNAVSVNKEVFVIAEKNENLSIIVEVEAVDKNAITSQNSSILSTPCQLTRDGLPKIRQEGSSYIIDEKIYMDFPKKWSENEANGRSRGKKTVVAVCVVGLVLIFTGGWALLPPFLCAATAGVSVMAVGTGLYFGGGQYLQDPWFIQQARQEDLQKGFIHAYKQGRADLTLTPRESRNMFIYEFTDPLNTLKELPIVLVTDVCKLTDPLIARLFNLDERGDLLLVQNEFIKNRNVYNLSVQELESELLHKIGPYTRLKDAALSDIKVTYEQDPYVQTKKTLKNELDIKIEKENANSQISNQQKADNIQNAIKDYETYVNETSFVANLNAAQAKFDQNSQEIIAKYESYKKACKIQINYPERLAMLESGTDSINTFYNNRLITILSSIPPDSSKLPDIVDRRTVHLEQR